MIQPGFFDVANRLRDISVFGDSLERIPQVVDFEIFAKIWKKLSVLKIIPKAVAQLMMQY